MPELRPTVNEFTECSKCGVQVRAAEEPYPFVVTHNVDGTHEWLRYACKVCGAVWVGTIYKGS